MKEFKGTKGKWKLDPYNATLVCSTNSDNGQIAECRSPDVECNHIAYVSDGTHWEENEEIAKANAQLIAAAPELAKSLQEAIELFDNAYTCMANGDNEGLYNTLANATSRSNFKEVLIKAIGE